MDEEKRVECSILLDKYLPIEVAPYFTEEVFTEAVYLKSQAEYDWREYWEMVLEDNKKGLIKIEDIPFRIKTGIKIENKPKKKWDGKIGTARKLIDSKLKISEVAVKYGLKLEKQNKIVCPFHNDTDPSLSLDDTKNIFNCFGCNIKGDIIDFIGRLEEWKEKNLQRKH